MTRAVRTRLEIEAEIKASRAELIDIEDHPPMTQREWDQAVKEARARVDAAIETWAHVPRPRS